MSNRIKKMNTAENIVDFIKYAEKLKNELRYAFRSDGNRESVAEHSWRLTLFVLLVEPHLENKIELLRTLKMAIIHDLVEIESKDVSILMQVEDSKLRLDKADAEKRAALNLKKRLDDFGSEFYSLWVEYEKGESQESKVVRALDKLEGQMQFLSEEITDFPREQKAKVEKIVSITRDACSADVFLSEIDRVSLGERLDRTIGRMK
jgi:putative hydrolase of HD superfamily